jgi:hypothetical protein
VLGGEPSDADGTSSDLDGGPSEVTVSLDGGELLVEVGHGLRIHLTGWARPVFEGRLSEQFVQELQQIDERP